MNDEFAVTLTSIQGGDIAAPVIIEKNQSKHIGAPKQEPIIIQFSPASVSKELFAWLTGTLAGTAKPMDGIISAAGRTTQGNAEEFARQTFRGAMITEIQFPALDGASAALPPITVTLQPEHTYRTFSAVKQIHMDSANTRGVFMVDIPTLQASHVRKVSALIFKRDYFNSTFGEQRSPNRQSLPPTISNLVLTIHSSQVAGYQAWFEDFVIKRNSGVSQEKQCSIRYMNERMEGLFTLKFSQLGVVRIGLAGPLDSENVSPFFQVEMYCGGVSLIPGPSLAEGSPAVGR